MLKRISAIIWGIATIVKIRLRKRKVSSYDELVKKTFNFVGSTKRPHPGMSLFSRDPGTGEIQKVPIIKNEDGSNGFLPPGGQLVWALNHASALRKYAKYDNQL